MTPRLSIITPVYNGEQFIRRCYWSLANQTIDDWEWVIVDDGSTDGTPGILHALALADSRLRVLRNRSNAGIGYARTWALAEARTSWVVICDIDDFSFPWRLERVTQAMSEGYDFMCSLVVVADPAMRILGVRDFEIPLYGRDILAFTHPSLACRTELARTIGYSPALRTVNQIGEDRRIILTLSARYRGYYHQAPLVIHQPSVGSLRRSIHSNLVGIYRVSQLFHDGTLDVSLRRYLQTQTRDCIKLALLNLLRLRPVIYDRIMDRRRLGPPARHYRLTERDAEFVDRCTSPDWRLPIASKPRVANERDGQRRSMINEQPSYTEEQA
jgi:glycosyltransferase involved in cell wall biosynthesis